MEVHSMRTEEVRRVWAVVFAQSGIPIEIRLFREYAEAAKCQKRWERTAREEYDAVALFVSQVS
jgi:hypothetical protein